MTASTKTKLLNRARSALFQSTGVDRLLPMITCGKQPSSLPGKLPPNPSQYPAPTLRSMTRNGFRYELDISDFMEWCVYFGIVIEPREALFSLIKPGDVVIDVGANIGEVTLGASARVGREGSVYSFEANPLVFEKLRRHIALNGVSNVNEYNMGLSDQAALVHFYSPEGNRGGGRVAASGDAPGGAAVNLIALDEFWTADKIRLDLIKVDVEGHEHKVLRGAEKTLRRHHPKLFVELNDANLRKYQSSASELLQFLENLGYKMSDASSGARLTSQDEFSGRHLDFVAVARETAA